MEQYSYSKVSLAFLGLCIFQSLFLTPDPIFSKVAYGVNDLAAEHGFSVENHTVETEDGYILTLHRIHQDVGNWSKVDRPIVFLGHPLMGSSASFLFNPPENSLAMMMANEGYDVWMINIRGNVYSRNHAWLKTCTFCSDFWSFSFDESSRYDYPAAIDYVLEYTSSADLFFVGYSMGTTQYLILLSELPEYNAKIRTGYLMGPSVFLGNASNPVIPFQRPLLQMGYWLGFNQYPHMFAHLSRWFCSQSSYHAKFCQTVWSYAANSDDTLIEKKTAMTHLSNVPAGSSLKTFVHYFQLMESGKFARFDYGTRQNIEVYGTSSPPEYNLTNVQAPTVLYCGDADDFANLEDHTVLANDLTNLRKLEVVPRPGWTHLDFSYSKEAGNLVYKSIIEDINEQTCSN